MNEEKTERGSKYQGGEIVSAQIGGSKIEPCIVREVIGAENGFDYTIQPIDDHLFKLYIVSETSFSPNVANFIRESLAIPTPKDEYQPGDTAVAKLDHGRIDIITILDGKDFDGHYYCDDNGDSLFLYGNAQEAQAESPIAPYIIGAIPAVIPARKEEIKCVDFTKTTFQEGDEITVKWGDVRDPQNYLVKSDAGSKVILENHRAKNKSCSKHIIIAYKPKEELILEPAEEKPEPEPLETQETVLVVPSTKISNQVNIQNCYTCGTDEFTEIREEGKGFFCYCTNCKDGAVSGGTFLEAVDTYNLKQLKRLEIER